MNQVIAISRAFSLEIHGISVASHIAWPNLKHSALSSTNFCTLGIALMQCGNSISISPEG